MPQNELEARIQRLEDIEAIRKLQYAYGYYLAHWQENELMGLFSDDTLIDMAGGSWKGKEGVRKFFAYKDHYGTDEPMPNGYLHQLMPLCGIIHVDKDGKTAKARFYGFGVYGLPIKDRIQALMGTGIWENEFIKENGVWKFKVLRYSTTFSSPYEKGWIKDPTWAERPVNKDKPPLPSTNPSKPYPSGYIFPYHYKNPVTGK